MNSESDNRVVIIQHRKTFAPIILAIIAFVLWIPSLLCNVICASAMQEMTNGKVGSSLFLPSILGLVVFALCFSLSSSCQAACPPRPSAAWAASWGDAATASPSGRPGVSSIRRAPHPAWRTDPFRSARSSSMKPGGCSSRLRSP